MEEQEGMSFAWTFPLFILAANYRLNPDRSITFMKDTLFATPKIKASDEPHLAIFSDVDLAERYKEQYGLDLGATQAIGIGPIETLQFLRAYAAAGRLRMIAIDPNPQTRLARTVSTGDMIKGVELYLASQA